MTHHRFTSHNHAPVRPMSEARRQHIHGPLQTTPRPIPGGLIMAALVVCAVALACLGAVG